MRLSGCSHAVFVFECEHIFTKLPLHLQQGCRAAMVSPNVGPRCLS